MSTYVLKTPFIFIFCLSASMVLAQKVLPEETLTEPTSVKIVTEVAPTKSEESEPTLAEAMTKISQLTFLVSELGIIVDKIEAERSATKAWCSTNPGISLCEVLGYY